MSAILGRNFIIKLATGNAAGVAVAGQKTGSISMSGDTVETTVKGDGAAKTYLGNQYSWTVTLSGVYDLTDGGTLAGYLTVGTLVNVSCFVGETEEYKGTGIVTSISAAGDQADVMTYDMTIQGTGALTIA